MSNYNNLKTTIDANIKQNGNQEITGPILNSVLNQMVNILGTGYQFAGIATLDPATEPGTPDAKVFYIANGKGTYTNFGGLEVTEDEVVVLYWDTAWHKVATGIASQAKLSELENTIKGTILNVSLTYPTGGVDGTNIYTKDGARLKVPVPLRKTGLILIYETENGIVMEQNNSQTYDTTEWVYGSGWIDYQASKFVNINYIAGQTTPFNDAGSARYKVPSGMQANCKGLVILYLLADGWVMEICNTDTFTTSVTGWIRIVEKSSVVIGANQIVSTNLASESVTNDKIANGAITIGKINASEFAELPKVGEDKLVKADGIARSIDYYHEPNFTEPSVIDLSAYTLLNGFYIPETGEFENHASRKSISEFIPIKAGSLYDAVMADGCTLYIHYYNVKADGSFTWLGCHNSGAEYKRLYFFAPLNCNAVRFSFYPYGSKSAISTSDVTSANFNITITSAPYVTSPSLASLPYIDMTKVCSRAIKIDRWLNGNMNLPYYVDSNRVSIPIKVIPGHRYAIDFNGFGKVTDSILYGSSDFLGTYTDITFALKEQGYISKENNYVGITYSSWIVPKGVNFIKYVLGGVSDDNIPLIDAHIVDLTHITEKGGKFMPLHTQGQVPNYPIGDKTTTKYSQGMCMDGGYIFQGYSTGEIEVLNAETKEYVSMFTIDNSYHLGSLTIGEKYDENDEFGLLWIGDITSPSNRLEAYRITRTGTSFSASKVHTITPPIDADADYQNYVLNIKEKKLVAVGGYNAPTGEPLKGSLKIVLYKVSEWTSSAQFTEIATIDYPISGVYPYQSGMIVDGRLFAVMGSHHTQAKVYCFDFVQQEMIYGADLRQFCFDFDWREEPQAICMYGGDIYLSGSYNIYKITL